MHLNSQKRIYLENAIYFVTTKTKGNYPYFRNRLASEYLCEVIHFAQNVKTCNVYGYVIIPDHLHILVQPKGEYTISDFMHCLKRHSSRNLSILMSHNIVGEDGHPRLRSGGIWQSSFHDHIIRDERDLFTHLEYIKINPVKHGVVKEGETYPFMHIDEQTLG